MRFGNNKLNRIRIREHFAFFPITIEGETRWLEKVKYKQEWYAPDGAWGWYNVEFIN